MTHTDHHHRTPRRLDERGVVISEFVLVVVVVVALLVVIVVSVRGIRGDATASDCRTQLRALKVATEQYRAETGGYPVGKGAVVDRGLVKAADVADYTVAPSADGSEPVFTAVGDCA